LINTYQVRDIAALGKGYTVYGGDENITYVKGPDGTLYTAKYVEGDAGGVRVQAQYEISALAEGVGFEMNRREAASLQAIEIIGAVNLALRCRGLAATLSGGGIFTIGIAGRPVTITARHREPS
jgi:hypothetical protein